MEDENLPENKDATSVNDSYAMTATIKELLKETTLDVSLPTLEESHHDDTDTGSERKLDASSNTDTHTTLVHGGNEATLDVSLPTLEKSHHDDTGGDSGECKPDTPTTLVHGGNKATLDVSVPTLEESLHDDTGGEHKPDAPSNTMVATRQHFMSTSQHCKHLTMMKWRLFSTEARSNPVRVLMLRSGRMAVHYHQVDLLVLNGRTLPMLTHLGLRPFPLRYRLPGVYLSVKSLALGV
jgi:hypothetical protein